MKQRQN